MMVKTQILFIIIISSSSSSSSPSRGSVQTVSTVIQPLMTHHQLAHSIIIVIRAAVFLRQILPYSAAQFVKFHGAVIPKYPTFRGQSALPY